MSYYNVREAFDRMIGRKLASINLDKGHDRVTFVFEEGAPESFSVEGDCCSRSWIEHLETYCDPAGATITSVDDQNCGVLEEGDYECLQQYETRFRTDRGDIVLEYRNSSNGYYGGYLVCA